jgi:hypothetical protein
VLLLVLVLLTSL